METGARVLILRSTSRNFPLDLEPELVTAGYTVVSLANLHAYVASPMRQVPQLLVLEIGSLADLDRALVVVDWNEHVQPLAPARYILLMASKNLSLGDRAAKLGGAEISVLPQPTRNLLFKLELQTRLLRSAPARSAHKEGFSAHIEEVHGPGRKRVMIIKGPGAKEGAWQNHGGTPTGKVRWRWVKPQGAKPSAGDAFTWQVETGAAPRFSAEVAAWVVEEAGASLVCQHQGETLYASPVLAPETSLGPEGRTEKFVSSPAAGSPPSQTAATVGAGTSVDSAGPVKSAASQAAKPLEKLAREKSAPAEASKTAAETIPESRPDGKAVSPAPGARAPTAEVAAEESSEPEEAAKEASSAGPAERARAALAAASAAMKEKNRDPKEAGPGPAPGKGAKESPRAESAPRPERPESHAKQSPTVHAEATEAAPSSSSAAPLGKPEKAAAAAREAAESKTASAKERIAALMEETRESREKTADVSDAAPLAAPRKKEALPSLGEPVPMPSTAPGDAAPPAVAAERQTHFSQPAAGPGTPGRNWISGPAQMDPGNWHPTSGEAAPVPSAMETAGGNAESGRIIPAVKVAPPVPIEEGSGNLPPGANDAAQAEKGRIEISGNTPPPAATRENPFEAIKPVVAEADQRAHSHPLPEDQDARRFLKTRHYHLMTLAQLDDHDSSWHPAGRYRVYLSAQHRYYGLKDPQKVLPLWIYDGELAPEFIDEQKSWKFYDCLPIKVTSLDSLPLEALENIYRMCGLPPPSEKEQAKSGKSVVMIESAAGAQARTKVDPYVPETAAPRTGAWGRIKKAIKGLVGK
ncbi:MAG: hypothetical protein ACXWR4_10405 [Bdellovibrionota bacterium]